MCKHLAKVERKNSPLEGRNLVQNQTNLIGSFYCGGVAALHEFLLKD